MIRDGLWDVYNNVHMGTCDDRCAEKYNFSRQQHDDFAVASFKRAIDAQEKGLFATEITPVEVPDRRTTTIVDRDEGPSRFNEEKLRGLQPAFDKTGTVTAGIDFSTWDGLLNLWTDPKYFDVDAFVDAFGNCPAEYLQACFLLLKPVRSFLAKNISLFEKLEDKKYVDEFLTMETWLNDNVPVAGEVFREFVKHLYQQNLLVQNRLTFGNRTVNLKQITCPVLNLMAEHDDLVPPAQSQPFNDLVGSHDRESIRHATGHIGLAMGSSAQCEMWPHVVEWLAKRS